MKKRLMVTVIASAVFALAVGFAASAQAYPTKTVACTNCHRSTTSTKVALTRLSRTATYAKYRVKVSGSGVKGWALFLSGKNIKRATSYTGTFTVRRGKTYYVWGVATGYGAHRVTLKP